MTKLIKAAASGNLESVKTCLAQGEDVNQVNENGYTALGWACYNHNPAKEHDFSKVINLFLNAGASANSWDELFVNVKNYTW